MKKFQRSLITLCAVCVLSNALCVTSTATVTEPQQLAFETTEAHDTYQTAMAVTNDITYKCFLAHDVETDWFVVQFSEDAKANFWICYDADASLDIKVCTLSDGKLVYQTGGTAQPNHQAFVTDYMVTGGVDYYIKISGTTGSGSANYDLRTRQYPA